MLIMCIKLIIFADMSLRRDRVKSVYGHGEVKFVSGSNMSAVTSVTCLLF